MKTSAQPIIEYKDDEQLIQSLREWQERLFLRDWTIKAKLCTRDEMPEDSKDALGYCWSVAELRAARISILRMDDDIRQGELIKPCHEKVLIHELMHCKRLTFKNSESSVENCSFAVDQHRHVEEMAKSLLMAKYDLSFEWFENV